jgi:predicted methyltransferase
MTKIILPLGLAGLLTASLSGCAMLETGAAGMHEGAETHHAHMTAAEHAHHYAHHHAGDIAAAIAAEDRAEDERARDGWRRPDITLAFSQIEPGARVLDVGAGGGYYTMLLSGLVGPEGHVIGQSPQVWVDAYGANWPEQHGAKIASRDNIEFIVAEFDDMGIEAGSLDAITFMLTYHDAALLLEDRSAMNAAFFDALRPGGSLMISDHNAPGVTSREAMDAVHRIEPSLVQSEVEAAGFELVLTTDAIANPDDNYALNIYHPDVRGQTDRFVYLFQKPE